jgi:RHS repeat-associated protein
MRTMNASKRRLIFEYDYQGRRIRKKVFRWNTAGNNYFTTPASDLKFIYDGWNLLAELNATNNTVVRSYLWGLDLSGTLQDAGGVGGLAAVKTAGGAAHFPAYDLNGNVIGLVDSSDGSTSAIYEYGPFGEVLRATGPMARENAFRFSTKYQDDETGLNYYGYRYYSASMGRWLSADPLGEEGGLNLHCFVENGGANYFDPLGLILFENSQSSLLVFTGLMYDPRNAAANARVAAYYGKTVVMGAPGALAETFEALANPIETIEAIAELRHLTRAQLECIFRSKFNEFMNASPERQAEMIGRVIVGIEAGILTDAAFVKAFAKLKNLRRAGEAAEGGTFRPATEFYSNASGNSYRVFQRSDINWNHVRTTGDRRGRGLTNAEAAERFGLAPQLPDGHFATLHHSQQNALGPLFEASTRYHNIRNINRPPLHPYGAAGHPSNPMGSGPGSPRQVFQDREVGEYWMWRAMTR